MQAPVAASLWTHNRCASNLMTVKGEEDRCAHAEPMKTHAVARYSLMGCGWVALGLGAAGVFLPILPTAPFVILAAACFLRSSERLHSWIVEHRVFGIHVKDYLAGKGLQRRSKVAALTTLWASVSFSVALFVPWFFVDAALIVIAALVTAYIVRLPTCDPKRSAQEHV